VPDEIHQVPGIPRTLSGKKLEIPVRKILLGTEPERAADPNALANPEVLASFGGSGRALLSYLKKRSVTMRWQVLGPEKFRTNRLLSKRRTR
jgi:hypothetical protein